MLKVNGILQMKLSLEVDFVIQKMKNELMLFEWGVDLVNLILINDFDFDFKIKGMY